MLHGKLPELWAGGNRIMSVRAGVRTQSDQPRSVTESPLIEAVDRQALVRSRGARVLLRYDGDWTGGPIKYGARD